MKNLSRHETIQKLQDILEPWVPDATEDDLANEELHLITDLGLDSIGILQLILGIEKTFGVVIDNEELDMQVLSRVRLLADLIESKLYEDN